MGVGLVGFHSVEGAKEGDWNGYAAFNTLWRAITAMWVETSR